MENMSPEEASATLLAADQARTTMAQGLVLPSFLFASLGAAVALQLATTTLELVHDSVAGRWSLAAGVVAYLAVAATQLVRFRRLNGVWVGGLASRIVGGTAPAAMAAYVVAFVLAAWAADQKAWWLVVLGAVAGGAAYAWSGRRWWQNYLGAPAAHARAESAALLATIVVVALGGLFVLAAGS
ncbi:hypothetical protein acdb102_06360 [Acidothermaceae bacterium B102]|nr:hypothetical protein acdb102_06360 [Acidothermaceae bacterium B102]